MGFYDQLVKKYDYTSSFQYDVAIVCPAINPKLWLKLHENLSSNEANFILILIGHVRPGYQLPNNMIYIFSEMGPVPCGDIGYQYVFDNNLAPYIIWAADDNEFHQTFLDDLLKNYKTLKSQYPNRKICVSPLSHSKGGRYDFHGWSWGGGRGVVLGAHICLSTEDAKLLGGGDKRFRGLDSHIDRQMRFYSELGGIIIVLDENVCKSTREKAGYSQMLSKTGKHDRKLLQQLYRFERLPDLEGKKNEIYFCQSKRGGDRPNFIKQRWMISHTSQPQLYSREELKFEEPSLMH